MPLDARERRALLSIGCESIERGLASGRLAPWPGCRVRAGLDIARATFTTLRRDGLLRGCCGTLEAKRTVAEDVWHNAWASAFTDPRFAPLARSEYARIELQISVLSELAPLPAASEQELSAALRPGVDGLVLEAGVRRATFLPAVWEELPEPQRFVGYLKQKAGWPEDYWPPGLRAYRYTTECFATEAREVRTAVFTEG